MAEILAEKGVAFELSAFSSGEDLLAYLENGSAVFDLFLLDIFMKEINGIDTAKAIRRFSESAAIIFTTSSGQHVFSGYEVQALQYLLKPIGRQALAAALSVDLKRRFDNRFFIFKSTGMTQKVPYSEIEYFESSVNSVKLVTKQASYKIYDQISNFETLLPRLSFCRCHRGFIINFRQVAKMNALSFITESGTVIPIGKTYADTVGNAFLNYIDSGEDTL